MRASLLACCLFAAGPIHMACADQPPAARARPCPDEAYLPRDVPADASIELEIRVLEVNASQLKRLGFDFASFGGGKPTVPFAAETFEIGVAEPGFIGFVDALYREGLVQQDLTLSHKVADGASWETALRWRHQESKHGGEVWRNVHLRVHPTSIAGGTRLDAATSARLSRDPDSQHTHASESLVDCAAELNGQTLGLATRFAADPDAGEKDEIRLLVLITPRANSHDDPDDKSCPDLLAPRNVLNRHAQSAPSRAQCDWFASPACNEVYFRPDAKPDSYRPFADDSLLDEAPLGDGDVFVTPDDDLLDEQPPHSTEVLARKLLVIKLPKQRPRRTRAPRVYNFGGIEVSR